MGAGAPTLGPLQEHLVLLLLTVSPVRTRVSSAHRLEAFKPFSLSHQGGLVYPKALQAPQELGASATAPSHIPSFPLLSVSHESL